jgi:hypothetical protein
MSTVDEIETVTEEDRVIDWRREQIRALGFNDSQADLLAYSPDVDLARVRSLVRAGCEHVTVMRILL